VNRKNLEGKTEGDRPLTRSKRRWKNNIKMYPKEIFLNAVDWINP
jgi:hypothetical protein